MKFIQSSLDKKYVQRKLVYRLRIFYTIFFLMICILSYDLFINIITFPLVLGGFTIGIIIGFIVGSISKIYWHEEKSKVISKMDWAGGVILVIYLSFSFSRRWIFGHWLHGAVLSSFCFSIIAGIMPGRLISTRTKVKSILKEKGYLKSFKK